MTERIKLAAYRLRDGRIVEDICHGFALAQVLELLELTDGCTYYDDELGLEDGFTTTTGRFVGRMEALQIARAAAQYSGLGNGVYLLAEDVEHSAMEGR